MSTAPDLVPTPSRATVAATGVLGATSTAVVALVDPYRAGHYPGCPLLVLTGLYCPFCGGLRAVHDLAHLDLLGALERNPLVTLAAPVVLVLWFLWAQQPFTGRLVVLRTTRRTVVLLGLVLLSFAVLRNLPGWSALSPA